MNNNFLAKISSVTLIWVLLFISSCQEEVEDIAEGDTADIQEEALTEAYFQDLDDIAGVTIAAPTNTEYSGGRSATSITVNDQRFNCDGVVVTLTRAENSTQLRPIGTITVDFGVGCTDLKGNIRTGKLNFAYDGRRFIPGSKVVITPENYSINGIKLGGTRTMTNVQADANSAPRFNVLLEDGKATFEDQSIALRESNVTWEWIRAANPVDDHLIIEEGSTANGTTRAGSTYEMSVSFDLKYKRFCGIAVEGGKDYVIDGTKEISINYGTGTCDKSVEITMNGITKTITIK